MPNAKELFKRAGNIYLVPIEMLKEEQGFNFRESGPDLDQYIRDLADYIKENGVPGGPLIIKWKGEEPFVRDGHCRFFAAKLAISEGCELKVIECRMMDKTANDADEIALLVTANSGRPISPLEMSAIVKRLAALKLAPSEIAKKIGKSPSLVSHLLTFSAAPEEVKTLVKEGRVAASTVVRETRRGERGTTTPAERIKRGVAEATAQGKAKATARHMTPETLDRVEEAKKLIRGMNDEDFLVLQDWLVEEDGRREEKRLEPL